MIKRKKLKITCYLLLEIMTKKILTVHEKLTSKLTANIIKNVSQSGEEGDCLHIRDIHI